MPTDQRSVHEVLLEADLTARDLLLHIDPAQAPAMIRAWPAVTQAAQALWATFPAGTDPRYPAQELPPAPMRDAIDQAADLADTLRRGRARSNARDTTASPWPPPGDLDTNVIRLGENLMRAAELIDRHAGVDQVTGPWGPAQQKDLNAAATRAMHSVYVCSHAVAITCEDFAKSVRARIGLDIHRNDVWALRPARQADHAAALLRETEYVTGQALARAGTPMPHPAPPEQRYGAERLSRAVRGWNRATSVLQTGQVTAGQLRWACHIETAMIAGTGAIARAREHLAGQQQPTAHEGLRAAHQQWTRVRQTLEPACDATDQPPREQILAGNELVAALRDLTWDRDGAATPETLAGRVNPAEALLVLDGAHRHGQALAGDITAAAAQHRIIGHARPLHEQERDAVRSGQRRATIPATALARNAYVRLPSTHALTIENQGHQLAGACSHAQAVLRQTTPPASRASLAEALGPESPAARTRAAANVADLMNAQEPPVIKTDQTLRQARKTFARGTERIARLQARLDQLDNNTAPRPRKDDRRAEPPSQDGPRMT